MDQELKQRLIGAAVITALAAIFVPMLFDDPIDETGKSISELKIPELPIPSGTSDKTQDVEIMPLPEKVEDVATIPPEPRPSSPVTPPAIVEEGDEESALEAPRPRAQITEKEAVSKTPPAKWIESDEDVAAAESEPVVVKPIASVEKPKAVKSAVKTEPNKEIPAKIPKPISAPTPTPVQVDAAVKPASATESVATENPTVRWYLNAGSFSQKANAVTLQDSLKKQGFAASVKEVVGAKGAVFKVRVGPMLDKAKAQAMKSKLAQINVNSFVSGDE